jgi:hypothetical protein
MQGKISDDETVNFYAREFFLNFRSPSKNQLSNMVLYAINFCLCFKGNDSEIKELKEILYDPIGYILRNNSEAYSFLINDRKRKRLNIKKTLGQLEWLDFRDGLSRTGLRKRYYVDEYRVKHTRFISHGDIKDFNLFLKISILTIFNKVRQANDVKLAFDFTNVPISPVQSIGVDQR